MEAGLHYVSRIALYDEAFNNAVCADTAESLR